MHFRCTPYLLFKAIFLSLLKINFNFTHHLILRFDNDQELVLNHMSLPSAHEQQRMIILSQGKNHIPWWFLKVAGNITYCNSLWATWKGRSERVTQIKLEQKLSKQILLLQVK